MSGITKSTSFGIKVNSAFQATITVSATSGCTVTATKGSTSIPCIWDGTNYSCTVNESGTYTITATKNGESKNTTVNVTQSKNYNVSIIFGWVINITSAGSTSTVQSNYGSYITIGNSSTKIYSIGTYEVDKGDSITVYAKRGIGSGTSGSMWAVYVDIDGTIYQPSSGGFTEYSKVCDYTPTSNCNISLKAGSVKTPSITVYVTITTT